VSTKNGLVSNQQCCSLFAKIKKTF